MIDIIYESCDRCGLCIDICPVNVYLETQKGIRVVNEELCVFCGNCIALCHQNAIQHEYLNYH